MPLSAVARLGEGVEEDDRRPCSARGAVSFTQGSPRRAVARQLMRRMRSPGTNGRRSANSIPSPRMRGTWLPADACVSSGASSRSTLLAARVDLQRLRQLELLLEDEQAEAVLHPEQKSPTRYAPQRSQRSA